MRRPILAIVASTLSIVVLACMEPTAPSVVADVSGTSALQPAACAEWSCNAYFCGHPTASPYHACCAVTVYDEPYGTPEDPGEPAPEPNCGADPNCQLQNNFCFWAAGSCHVDPVTNCPLSCNSSDPCPNDPTTYDLCQSITDPIECEATPS